MTQTDAATVRKQVVVDAPIKRAFSVFTDRFGDFKPPEHNLLGAPIAETVFEGRVGGSIVDRAVDGSECRWARILAFDPPDRVVFSWDISPQWTIETDQAQTSEVEVRFYAESPTRTRVELEHRHIDRHGPGWEAITGGVDGPEGWPLYLDRYAAPDKGWTDRDEARWPVPYWHIDAGFASLLVLLGAVDAELGACFFGIPPERFDAYRAAFDVPVEFTPIGAISIGYPAPDRRSPSLKRGRRPVADVAHRGRWGRPY